MTKKKKPAVEAFDKEGPATLAAGYTWCPECQASFQGDVCPGCSIGESPGIAAFDGLGTERPAPTTLAEPAVQASITPEEAAKAVVEIATEGLEEMMNTEITTSTEILPVPLTDPEYKEFGIKLGLANQEISQAEDELASVKSQYKSRIVSAEGRRNEYAAIINAGHQQKQVECNLVKDFTENVITLVRLDTGEVVRTRTMTTAERQRGLFQPPPPDPSCIDPTD